jgi:hypothetical protein
MKVFDFNDYKAFLKDRILEMPGSGRGFRLRMAEHLRIHTTLVSQVLNGPKHFTLEQAALLCELLALPRLEARYFLALVQSSRAGNETLRRQLASQLQELKAQGEELVHRLPPQKTLTEEAKGVFYSSWQYSAVRLCASIEGLRSAERIAEYLGIPPSRVARLLEFLLNEGLVVEQGGGLALGPPETHLEADSPHVSRHHANWRLRALERTPPLRTHELMFTSPLTIAREDMPKIRQSLVEAIDEATKVVLGSKPDTLACLNIDWFEAAPRDR